MFKGTQVEYSRWIFTEATWTGCPQWIFIDTQVRYLQWIFIYTFEQDFCKRSKKWLIGYLIINLQFYVRLKNISLNGDFAIAPAGLQNLGLCSALRAFEQGGIFILPHLL
jgi:hypothetical protein